MTSNVGSLRKRRRISSIDDGIRKRRYLDDEEYTRHIKKSPTQDMGNVGGKSNLEHDEKNSKELKIAKRNHRNDDLLITARIGGAYIPPAKLRLMLADVTDKKSAVYQRLDWEALKKSIQGLINKVNISNIKPIIKSLIRLNLVRGRGLLCRSITHAQAASPSKYTRVYAALIAVLNTRFEDIGRLLLSRLILQFRKAFERADKKTCISSTTFIAHLVNQQVAHENLALEILVLLLENANDNNVEIAISFLKECGEMLSKMAHKALAAVFERLRHVLYEADLDKRVKYAIEVLFHMRKEGFKNNPAVIPELDLVEESDRNTHVVSLEEYHLESQDVLDVFQLDSDYEEHEKSYEVLMNKILGSDEVVNDDTNGEDEGDGGSETDEIETEEENNMIVDETKTNLLTFRRHIYLTIQSSLDHNECVHKILKMSLTPWQKFELCHMVLDCCTQQRTYEKFFGLLAQRLCLKNDVYGHKFGQLFKDTYDVVHRLDSTKLRNAAKMFAHLLFVNAIYWDVFSHIRISEGETTSSSRIFLKVLFQELAEHIGLRGLNARFTDPILQASVKGIFPRDNPKNTRFSVNFFTCIGLGSLASVVFQ